jgi:DtxR family transcriptional regulator, Mn-dependent transcriptional regulator
MNDDLSGKMRVCLAEIYRLADMQQPADGFVSTSMLADLLFVSAPAVNRMVNKLKEAGLLEHEPYQGIRLTETGHQQALQHLRVHRIAEAFLVRVMGIGMEDVYHEANQISGALGDLLVTRMNTMAGSPACCPHGEPIPAQDGSIRAIDDVWLSTAAAGSRVHLTRMRTRDGDRLKYLHALGLVPGTEFDVIHVAPFHGPMQLKVGREYRIIGYNLAELIRVRMLT